MSETHERRHRRMRWFEFRIWLLRHTPAGLLWHPFEWFCAGLCGLSGVVQLAGGGQSDSLAALLPDPFLKVWGCLLLIGAVALASGLSSIESASADRYVITRVPSYRLGLRLLGLAMGTYIIALALYAGTAGLVAGIAPTAFALSCVCRILQLGGR